MSLPKWLAVQKKQKVKVHSQQDQAGMVHKGVIAIEGRREDMALFVGGGRSVQIMQEMMDVEGYGRTRKFDADAKGGRSGGYRKGSKRLTKAERQAATVAHSIEK